MSNSEQPPVSAEIKNAVSNRGAQGVFNAPVYIGSDPPSSHDAQRANTADELKNRRRMLTRVRSIWIDGLLQRSLYREMSLTLELREGPDAITNPWRLALREYQKDGKVLPSGTPITKVYDQADGQLLILGEPGAGKTTLLLELARGLLDRAEKDTSHPIPIVFNLSSWSMKRLPISDWIIEELKAKYRVPKKLAQLWLKSDQVLPLLDGFDEIAAENRAACIDAISEYRQIHGLVPLIISSRTNEYRLQKNRLPLNNAVEILPLTEEQVNSYLLNAGGELALLRVAWPKDPVLKRLVTTPLMLNVLISAYQGMPINRLLTKGSWESRRHHVLMVYIKRMLQHRGIETRYTSQQTLHWLKWLSQQMRNHNQTEFYIEQIQPSWFSKNQNNQMPNDIVVNTLSEFLHFLNRTTGNTEIKPVEVVAWSWKSLLRNVTNTIWLRAGAILAIFNGLLFALLSGNLRTGIYIGLGCLVINLLLTRVPEGFSQERLDKRNLLIPNEGIRRSATNSIRAGLFGGIVGGLYSSMFGWLLNGHPSFGILTGVSFALLFGLPNGGFACIKHMVLRSLLWRTGCIPWNYSRFLDYAAEIILLRKVGGGYIFVHNVLLDYFSSLDPQQILKEEGILDQNKSIETVRVVGRRRRKSKKRG